MNNISDLTGRTAVITGSSSGLGVQYAKALAENGAEVVLLARRYEKLKKIKNEIDISGGKCMVIKCNITKEKEVEKAIKQIIKNYGKIDILINNAGLINTSPTIKLKEKDWNNVIDTNLKGMFLMVKHIGPHMIRQNYGRIINISSLFGLVGSPLFSFCHYQASKSGVIGLTKALAIEWANFNITVNTVCPGYFESEMTHQVINSPEFKEQLIINCPMQRIGNPGELNGIILYLSSEASGYTTGQVIAVDGGWTSK